MHEWEKVCFKCEVDEEKNGKFFCSTNNAKCKIKQLVDKGEIPASALRSGAPVIKQHSVGFDDIPLFEKCEGMTKFCRSVMKFPENVIKWSE